MPARHVPISTRQQNSAAGPLGRAARLFGVALLFVFCSSFAGAQINDIDVEPPPLKMLSKSEKEMLNSKRDVRERTNIAIGLMDARLKSAEKYSTDENFALAFAELGGFQGLVDNNLDFLLRSYPDSRRLSSLKRFEIGLRGFVPRLEGLRRQMPARFESYIVSLQKYVSEARRRSLEPLFGDAGQPG
ncbi:MAG: hypothetical protein ACK4S4_05310 [Pyrinomonadaceae bacterium]